MIIAALTAVRDLLTRDAASAASAVASARALASGLRKRASYGRASTAQCCQQAVFFRLSHVRVRHAAAACAPDPLMPDTQPLNPCTWYARTSSSRRMDSWMVWLEMAAAVRGATPLPCSKAWYASATASGFTPRSEYELRSGQRSA